MRVETRIDVWQRLQQLESEAEEVGRPRTLVVYLYSKGACYVYVSNQPDYLAEQKISDDLTIWSCPPSAKALQKKCRQEKIVLLLSVFGEISQWRPMTTEEQIEVCLEEENV